MQHRPAPSDLRTVTTAMEKRTIPDQTRTCIQPAGKGRVQRFSELQSKRPAMMRTIPNVQAASPTRFQQKNKKKVLQLPRGLNLNTTGPQKPREIVLERTDCLIPAESVGEKPRDDCDMVMIGSQHSSQTALPPKSPRIPKRPAEKPGFSPYETRRSPFSEIVDGSICEYLGNLSYISTREKSTKLCGENK